MRLLLLLLATLSLAALSLAATPIPPQQVTWTQVMIDPPTAQTFGYTLRILEEGNPTPREVSLINVLCGGTAPNSECAAALPIPAAQSAIITGNTSTLRALDPRTNLTSPLSGAFTGNQGCIFRQILYGIGERTAVESRKQEMNALLAEFQRAKFKHISTVQLGGNRFRVTEECVGYLVK
mgnify:CR=1 FL=1